MRQKLEQLKEQRLKFYAVFERYGAKTNYRGHSEKTILLKNVCVLPTNEKITDHLWFSYTKGFQALGILEAGDMVGFDARSRRYRKGYWGHDFERQLENPPGWDWKLNYPTKIKRIENVDISLFNGEITVKS